MKFVELRDVAEFIRGITYKPDELVENFSENSVVCMRTANVQKNLDESNLLSVPTILIKNDQKYLLEGDILVSTANSWNLVGKCSWVHNLGYKATAGGFIAILRANGEMINPRYLYHWFNSEPIQIQARNCGRQTTNISNMDIDRCLSIKVYLPSLEEQRRIASILDKADEIRQKRQQAIAKLDELLQATFIDMFGDPVSNPKGFKLQKLSEIGVISTGNTPSRADEDNYGNFIEWIKSDNLNNDFDIATQATEYLSEKGKQKGRIVPAGSILVTCIAGSLNCIGNLAIVDREVAFNQQINAVTPKENIQTEYLYYLLKVSKSIIQSFSTNAMKGMISKSTFSQIELPIASSEQQAKFVEIFNKFSDLKSNSNNELSELDNLFKALQQKAVSGTL